MVYSYFDGSFFCNFADWNCRKSFKDFQLDLFLFEKQLKNIQFYWCLKNKLTSIALMMTVRICLYISVSRLVANTQIMGKDVS